MLFHLAALLHLWIGLYMDQYRMSNIKITWHDLAQLVDIGNLL